MEVMVEDRKWSTGTYNFDIPMPRKLKSVLKALDRAGVFPCGLDGFIRLVAEKTLSVALARHHEDLAHVRDNRISRDQFVALIEGASKFKEAVDAGK
tara:strand:- start:12571 stop:12861 length:291 start_codon:yes stop_codon:yes gene_type:complete